MNNRKYILQTLCHITFWIVIGFFFVFNSHLRPRMVNSMWKECLVVATLISTVYVSYFILIPKMYLRGNIISFTMISVSLILLCGVFEFLLFQKDIDCCIGNALPSDLFVKYKFTVFFLCSLRTGCYVLCFDLLKLLQVKSTSMEKSKELIIKEEQKLLVETENSKMDIVEIPAVVYLKYKDRSTTIVNAKGCAFKEYNPLIYYENKLSPNEFIKINRSLLVAYKFIQSFDEQLITLQYADKTITFPIKKQIVDYLRSLYPNLYYENEQSEQQNQNKQLLQAILDYIVQNPYTKTPEIEEQFGLSRNVCQTYLTELKNRNLITFHGSRGESSGYVVIR